MSAPPNVEFNLAILKSYNPDYQLVLHFQLELTSANVEFNHAKLELSSANLNLVLQGKNLTNPLVERVFMKF